MDVDQPADGRRLRGAEMDAPCGSSLAALPQPRSAENRRPLLVGPALILGLVRPRKALRTYVRGVNTTGCNRIQVRRHLRRFGQERPEGGLPIALTKSLAGLSPLAGPRWDWLSFSGWQFLCGEPGYRLALIAERPSGAKNA